MKWWQKLLSLLGKHPFFTYDKFAHGWLHTIGVRSLRTIGLENIEAFAIMFCFGVLYELIDCAICVTYHSEKADIYARDSCFDLIWNLFGQIIGLII